MSQRTNPPAAQRICEALWQVIDACEDLLADHGDGCECDPCHDASGLLYNATLADECLDSHMAGWPARSRREADLARRDGKENMAAIWDQLAEREEGRPTEATADEPAVIQAVERPTSGRHGWY